MHTAREQARTAAREAKRNSTNAAAAEEAADTASDVWEPLLRSALQIAKDYVRRDAQLCIDPLRGMDVVRLQEIERLLG